MQFQEEKNQISFFLTQTVWEQHNLPESWLWHLSFLNLSGSLFPVKSAYNASNNTFPVRLLWRLNETVYKNVGIWHHMLSGYTLLTTTTPSLIFTSAPWRSETGRSPGALSAHMKCLMHVYAANLTSRLLKHCRTLVKNTPPNWLIPLVPPLASELVSSETILKGNKWVF